MSKSRKKRLVRVIILFLVLLLGCGYFAYRGGYLDSFISENKTLKGLVERKNLKIYDLYSDERPVAVMIDNIRPAWPQTGLSDAFLIYEIIVEGGQTRLMALFKDQDTATIGPVRSARHYYLDYALENDAIYVHFGGSGKAYTDIKSLDVDDLDGISNGMATRDKTRKAPHNAYITMDSVWRFAEKKGYRLTTAEEPVLPYSFNEYSLEKEPGVKPANKVKVVYSGVHTTNYVYNAETKLYSRSMNGVEHKDRVSGAPYTAKNIIIIKVQNDPLIDNSRKDRREVYTVGNGNGFFVTNGYYIPIKWSKSSRASKTSFTDLSGKEIKVNDGVTFIQVQPKDRTTTIE